MRKQKQDFITPDREEDYLNKRDYPSYYSPKQSKPIQSSSWADVVRSDWSSQTKCHFGISSLAIYAQFALLYWVSWSSKTGEEWSDGIAVYYILNLDHFVTATGKSHLAYPSLLYLMTKLTLLEEFLAPFFFLSPFKKDFLRVLVVFGLSVLHLSFVNLMEVGLFPYIPALTLVVLLPPSFWSQLSTTLWQFQRKFSRDEHKSWHHFTIYYNPHSPYCVTALALLKTFGSLTPGATFRPNEKPNANFWFYVSLETDSHASDIQMELFGFRAFYFILSHSLIFWPIAYALHKSKFLFILASNIFSALGNSSIVDLIVLMLASVNVTKDKTKKKTFGMVLRTFLKEVLVGFFLLNVVWWNMRINGGERPSMMANIDSVLRLDQNLTMFSHSIPREDGWFVISGKLVNNSTVDVLRRRFEGIMTPVSFEKPDVVSSRYPNHRWRMWMLNIWYNEKLRLEFGRWQCREWNFYSRTRITEKLLSFELSYMLEKTPPYPTSDETSTPTTLTPVKHALWSHIC